jgi:nucleoside-diphosphate-sugar epimerase
VKNKILITGSRGFLGSYLKKYLEEKNNVVCIDFDLTNSQKTEAFFKKNNFQAIYHLAGCSRVNQEMPFEEYFSKNFLTTAYLANALEKTNKKVSIFFASSIHVYGNQQGNIHEQLLPKPTHPYGFTKYLAEEALRKLVLKNNKIKVVVGRFSNCIGPKQPLGFVISDFCYKISKLPKQGGILKVGSLDSKRSFLDVRDIVRVLPSLLSQSKDSFEIFNIASQKEYKISEVLNKLISLSQKETHIKSDSRHNPLKGLQLDLNKFYRKISQKTFRPLEETLEDMYKSVL